MSFEDKVLQTVDAETLIACMQYEPDTDRRYVIAEEIFGRSSEWCYLNARLLHDGARPFREINERALQVAEYLSEFSYAANFTESPYESMPRWLDRRYHTFSGMMGAACTWNSPLDEFIALQLSDRSIRLTPSMGEHGLGVQYVGHVPVMAYVSGSIDEHTWVVAVTGIARVLVATDHETVSIDLSTSNPFHLHLAKVSVELPQFDTEHERQKLEAEQARFEREMPEYAHSHRWRVEQLPEVFRAVEQYYESYRQPQRVSLLIDAKDGWMYL